MKICHLMAVVCDKIILNCIVHSGVLSKLSKGSDASFITNEGWEAWDGGVTEPGPVVKSRRR